MSKREELLEQGYGCVVKGTKAHLTAGDCWSERDWLIPLKSLEEAQAHGYEVCRKCESSTLAPEPTRPKATSE